MNQLPAGREIDIPTFTGRILPPVDYDNIAPIPPLPSNPRECSLFLKTLERREEIVQRTSVAKDLWAIPDVMERAEELAGIVDLIRYGGATGIMGLLEAQTSRMRPEEAQKRIEQVLIASEPPRVSIVFSPYSSYALLPDLRTKLVARLGYEPLVTLLADTTQFDADHGITPRTGTLGKLGAVIKRSVYFP